MSDGISIRTSGSIFDGNINTRVDQGLKSGEAKVADLANTQLKSQFKSSFKVSTGKYERHVHIVSRNFDFKVTDGGVVYGPWLEGVGSRNNRTRFKGYAAFRKTTQIIKSRATMIATKEVISRIAS